MENFLFINFSFLAILGALGLISFKAPIHGALSMIVSLVAIAGLYLLFGRLPCRSSDRKGSKAE